MTKTILSHKNHRRPPMSLLIRRATRLSMDHFHNANRPAHVAHLAGNDGAKLNRRYEVRFFLATSRLRPR